MIQRSTKKRTKESDHQVDTKRKRGDNDVHKNSTNNATSDGKIIKKLENKSETRVERFAREILNVSWYSDSFAMLLL
jgi:hypothetical protein